MRTFFHRHQGRGLLDGAVILFTLSLLVWAGCDFGEVPGPSVSQEDQEVITLDRTNPEVRAVMALQNRVTDDIMSNTGIVGTGTGMTEDGQPAIVIMVETETVSKTAVLPDAISEVPVIVMVTGKIKAIKGPPGGGVDHTARFSRPVPLGVSTGHPAITAGTIGARLVDGAGNLYALSNNHVYADQNNATIGDAVIQPGTFDGGSSPADDIGTLAAFVQISFTSTNVVDAAIANTTASDVDNTTTSDCYGTPLSTTVVPAVRMRVQKCGRTTEFTTGRISAINATINVQYDGGVAQFVGQIVVSGGSFSAGGDSGSLVVVQKGSQALSPVGLLFAGGSNSTILNPIDDVLSLLSAEIGSTLSVDGN